MHFYSQLISILYPFVILNNNDDIAPSGEAYVVTYQGTQVVDYNNNDLIAQEA